MKLKHYISIAIAGLVCLTGYAAMIMDADDFEHDTISTQPTKATLVSPATPTTDISLLVVDEVTNTASTGKGVGLFDNNTGTGLQLEYDFTIISDTPPTLDLDKAARLSAVRVDLSFAPLSTTTTKNHFLNITLGEHLVDQSQSSTHFTKCQLWDKGTIDFVSTTGPDSIDHPLFSEDNTLSIFANDHDFQITYTGPNEASYDLPSDSVAYWLNGNRIDFGGQGYTAMENRATTNGGIVNSTNNLGRFAIVSTTSSTGLDYVFDDIMISDLDSNQDLTGSSWLVSDSFPINYTGYSNEGETESINMVPDYSSAGYQGGGVPIPFVPAAVTLSDDGPADDTARIEAAIQEVSCLPVGPDGFRGAVVLEAGEYTVNSTLVISTSGIVIRGAGSQENGGTRITFTSTAPAADKADLFLVSSGAGSPSETDMTPITDAYVPVGAKSFTVADASSYAPGDTIIIQVNVNQDWINDLGMSAAELGTEAWTTGYFQDIKYRRIVTEVTDNTITIDAPVLQTLQDSYGGANVYKYTYSGGLENIGFEGLRLESSYASATDENHGWDAIHIKNLENGWVRQVTARYFVYALVNITDYSRRITVEDCANFDAVCTSASGRRYSFTIDESDSVLWQRCLTRGGRHDFASGSRVQGPNVYVDCRATETYNDIGPHHRYSTGQLYDNIFGGEMNVQNRLTSGSGHGWSGAQIMFWNCDASSITADAPTGAMNWVVGSFAYKAESWRTPAEPFGIWDSENEAVNPRSLYYAQLIDRLGTNALKTIVLPQQKESNIWAELLLWDGDGLLLDDVIAWVDEEVVAEVNVPLTIGGVVRNLNMLDRGVAYLWTQYSGPGTVTFGDSTLCDTTATFSQEGTYVLELSVDDGTLQKSGLVEIEVFVDTTFPDAPKNLYAIAGDNRVFLNWDDNGEPDLTSYNVYRSTTEGVYGDALATGITSSDYMDTSAENGMVYYYLVTAVDVNMLESAQSDEEVSATPDVDVTPPVAPNGLVATAGDAEVSLEWNENWESDLFRYNIYRSTTPEVYDSSSPWKTTAPGSSDYIDKEVTNSITYYYWVTAVDINDLESAPSNISSTPELDVTAPDAPTGFVATEGFGSISLTWNENEEPDLVSYSVYRRTAEESYGEALEANLVASCYVDDSVDNETIYFYVVTATDTRDNESNYSAEISATSQEPVLNPGTTVFGSNNSGLRGFATSALNLAQETWSVEAESIRYINDDPDGTVDSATDGGTENASLLRAFALDRSVGKNYTIEGVIELTDGYADDNNRLGIYLFGDFDDLAGAGGPEENETGALCLLYNFDTGQVYLHQGINNGSPLASAATVPLRKEDNTIFGPGNTVTFSAEITFETTQIKIIGSFEDEFGVITSLPEVTVNANDYTGDYFGFATRARNRGDSNSERNAPFTMDYKSFSIIPNEPPAFTSDPIVEADATMGLAYSATLADDASDPESDTMTFSKVGGPAWLSVASDGTLSGTPGAGDTGLNSFTVQVDATGGGNQATLEITVNALPVADAGSDQTVIDTDVNGSELISLNGSGSYDNDSNIASYVWFNEGDPNPIATGVTPAPISLGIGANIITLVITNDNGVTDSDIAIIQVDSAGVTLPVADAGPYQIVADHDDDGVESVNLDGSASTDSIGGNVTSYKWVYEGSIISEVEAPTVEDLGIGVHTFTLVVADGAGATDSATVRIIVNEDNLLPVASAGVDQTVTVADENSLASIVLDGSGSMDIDGSITSYAWFKEGDPNPISTIFNPTVSDLGLGVHTFTLTVTDDQSSTHSDTVRISVDSVALAPEAPAYVSATSDDASVSLDWVDNTESDLASYRVYRSTTSYGYDFNNPLVTVTSSEFIDDDQAVDPVINGTTYYYVVTAVDDNGNESVKSYEVSATPTPRVYSDLWGVDGELWDPANGPLHDFSDVGYMQGSVPIPNWPVGVNVLNYGAVGDGVNDDTQAFRDAIAACPPEHAIFVPNGRYKITDWIRITDKDDFVLRGEDMYETVLWFPYNLSEVRPENNYRTGGGGAFILFNGGTQKSIENFSFEFREEQMGDHFNGSGANAIHYGGVDQSWIRNIYIKNANGGITVGGGQYVTVMNIVLDQYEGRPSDSENTVGHHGVTTSDSNHCLLHDIYITGKWQHEVGTGGSDYQNVYSRITMLFDSQIDHHAMNANNNLWTEINVGRGTRIWEQNQSTDNEYYWNIKGAVDMPYPNLSAQPYPDSKRANTIVGLKTSDPDGTSGTSLVDGKINLVGGSTYYWHETIDPDALYPANLYLAQLEKANKTLSGPALVRPAATSPNPNFAKAIEDSYVDKDSVDSNYGRSFAMALKHGNFKERYPYLKFDFRANERTNVFKATLRVYCGSLTSSAPVTAMGIEDDSWTEDTLTFNNRPTGGVTNIATATVDTPGAWVEWDITSFVNNQLATDKVISIYLDDLTTSDAALNFRSKDGPIHHPQIILIPEDDPTNPPEAPTGLNATSGVELINLDWDDNTESDVVSYNVYRSTTSNSYDFENPLISGRTTSDYEDTTVAEGTTYYYVVTAVDIDGNESDRSLEASAAPLPANFPPAFTSDPIAGASAVENLPYSGTISTDASDPESDPMTFSKVSGPAWLSVASDGTLSGTPEAGDVVNDPNSFTVQVDALGGYDTAILNITVNEAGTVNSFIDTGNTLIGDSANWGAGLPSSEENVGIISTGKSGKVGNTNALASETSAVGLFIEQEGGSVVAQSYRGSSIDNTIWTLTGGTLGSTGVSLINGSVLTVIENGALTVGNGRDLAVASGSTLTMDGGTASVGDEASVFATMVMNAGTMTVGRRLKVVGGGYFTINGGEITVTNANGEFGTSGYSASSPNIMNFNGGTITATNFTFQSGSFATFGGTNAGSVTFGTFGGDRHSDAQININWLAGSQMTMTVTDETIWANWAQDLWDNGRLKYEGNDYIMLGDWATVTAPGGLGNGAHFVYDSGTNTLSLVSGPVNNSPVAGDDAGSTDEDTAVLIDNVLLNDSDADGDNLSASFNNDAANGSVADNNDNTATYTPAENFSGIDSFTYTIDDGNGGTDTAIVIVTVNAINDAPVAVDDTATTDEDTLVNISVLSNDSDVEGDTLTISAITDGTNGTVATDGITLSYTPLADFHGSDSFTYTIEDGNGGSDTAMVTVTVNPVNDVPVAVDDSAITAEEIEVSGDVLANDTDVEGNALTVVLATDVSNGTLALSSDGSFTYTPEADFYGTDSFTYFANDGTVDSATSATLAITVTAVNDAPEASDDLYTVDEGGALNVPANGVLMNDTDVEGDALTASVNTEPLNGIVTLNTDGSFDYTHGGSETTSDSFTYTVSDGNGGTATATVNVTVNPVNDAPVAVDDNAVTDEDTSATIDVLTNDSDVEGDTLTISAITDGANGTVATDGITVSYTPSANFHGSDNFTYTIEDGNGGSDMATVNVTVNPVNDAPVAVDDSVTATEDTLFNSITELDANDSDVDGDVLSVVAGTGLATLQGGSIDIAGDGSYSYTPAVDFNGLDTVNYTVTDGSLTDEGTLTIDVTAVNDAPVAVDDNATTDEDTLVTIDVLTNDSDVESNTLTISAITDGANGMVVTDGITVSYTPSANFHGSDNFTYTIEDGNGGSDMATVNVTVNPVNDAPVAVDDSVTATEDTLFNSITELDANDSDVDGDVLSVVSGTFATTQSGSITIAADGSYAYTPAGDFSGVDTIDYTVEDGIGGSAIGTLTITVDSVNDAPVAVDDNATTDEDTLVTIDVLANDSDVDGDVLTISTASASSGTVSIVSGQLEYTPNANFNGPDTINYEISDSNGDSDTAAVNVTVNPINDEPEAVDDAVITVEDTILVIDALANDSDVDDDTLVISGSSVAGSGTVSIVSGQLEYTPNADFAGTDSFTYSISDNNGGSDTAMVTVTVNPVNDAPVAVDDSAITAEEIEVSGDVLANDTDVEGNALTVVLATDVSNGMLALSSDGSFTYTPEADFYGTDSFTYFANDGTVDSATSATVAITVTAVNDAPEASDDLYTVDEGGALNVPANGVLMNDTDVEGDALTASVNTEPLNGIVTLNTDGSFDYTHEGSETTSDSFTYTVSDGNGGTATATVNVTVNPVNDAPVAVDDNAVTDEDTLVTIDVLANDSDVDGDVLTISTASASSGTVSIVSGQLEYTPNANFNGLDTINYEISDSNGDSDTAAVNVTVNPINDEPEAVDDAVITVEDTILVIDALANDSDVDDDTLVISGSSVAGSGTVSIVSGQLEYTPNADFAGTDSFTYSISDNNGGSDTATVTVTVTAVNDDPQAVADDASVAEGGTLASIDVLSNDSDPESQPLNIIAITQGANGNVSDNLDGTLSYIHNGSEVLSDSFTYTISDGNGGTNTAMVNVTVIAVNDAPVAVDDSTITDEDTAVSGDVLANDMDVEDNPLTAVLATNVSNGTLVLNSDGSFDYTPNVDFNGTDSFTYVANDGTADSATAATVTITVEPVNDLPSVSLASAMTNLSEDADTSSRIKVADVVISDVDAGTNDLSLSGADAVHFELFEESGSMGLYLKAGESLDYETASTLGVTVNVDDATVGTSPDDNAAYSLTVIDVNEAPSFTSTAVTTVDEDTPYTYTVTTTDPDAGDTVTVTAPTLPGWLSFDGTTLSGTPSNAEVGDHDVTLSASDGSESVTQVFTITVEAAPPVDFVDVNFSDFETDWGVWDGGGVDARRNAKDAVYAAGGTYCIRLRDNTDESVMTTDNLNLAGKTEIKVEFDYYVVNFNNSNEDFWLQISTDGGNSYTTVEEWNLYDEFENYNSTTNPDFYSDQVIINGYNLDDGNVRLRFRCDGSGNGDKVYIDNVKISAK